MDCVLRNQLRVGRSRRKPGCLQKGLIRVNTKNENPARRQKVQSAETGLEMLKALAALLPGAATLSALAEAAGMAPSKAHRYLQALIAGGFAEQDPATGRYGLGPEALYVGVAALGRIDVVAAAADPLAGLSAELDQTCLLAVWANRGATVVQVSEAPQGVTVVTRIGSVLPLATSATGLVFAAFLPPTALNPAARAELAQAQEVAGDRVAAVRGLGLAVAKGLYHSGVDAISAPVFGLHGVIAAVITTMGPTTSLDLDIEGPSVAAVRDAARRIAERIGHR
jgi:DNA-binding IclR family transcriptional regulator